MSEKRNSVEVAADRLMDMTPRELVTLVEHLEQEPGGDLVLGCIARTFATGGLSERQAVIGHQATFDRVETARRLAAPEDAPRE